MNLNCTVNQVKIKGEIKMTYEYEKTSLEVVEQYEPVRRSNRYPKWRLYERAINRETGDFFAVSHAGGVDDRPSGDNYLGYWQGQWIEIELTFENGGTSEETRWTHYTGVRRIWGVTWQDGFTTPDYTPLDEAVADRKAFFEGLKEAIIVISNKNDANFGFKSPRTITFNNLS
jgi:hypothetical protein